MHSNFQLPTASARRHQAPGAPDADLLQATNMFIGFGTNHLCEPPFIGRNLSALTKFETQLKWAASGRSLAADISAPGRYLPNQAIGVVTISVEGGPRIESISRYLRQSYSLILM
ncbi:hypothetical protein MKX08_007126 [Trichoderma sp. CBMAI-0020]|nr:hypothetical protein MKX08_007126 [Trichoderma sp. CBMAI-0020]